MKLYTFYDKTFGKYTKEEVIKKIEESEDGEYKYEYTIGLEYRSPTTCHVPITKEEAINKIKTNSLVDVDLKDNIIHVNTFTTNDMW